MDGRLRKWVLKTLFVELGINGEDLKKTECQRTPDSEQFRSSIKYVN